MTIFSAIQITSTNNYEKNIEKSFELINKAKNLGSKVVSLPEVFTYIGSLNKSDFKFAQNIQSQLIKDFSHLAKKLDIYILAGSFHESIDNSDKLYNTSIFFSDNGEILNKYQKIHLFDADIPGPERYKESDNFESGLTNQTNVINTPYGNFGFSICYDLRFPEFYRKLTFNGAQVIFVPA
ncbi:MAG: nitrilase-related carbon-nitrogen hydrolase, partial [Candidatus Sericytochromatia bacterium]